MERACAAAIELARHGWSVLPGTYQLTEHACWLGKPSAVGLEPVVELWPMAATLDPDRAMDWWTRRPYSVLLACGTSGSAIAKCSQFTADVPAPKYAGRKPGQPPQPPLAPGSS